MQEKGLNNWEQFEEELKELEYKYLHLKKLTKTYPEHFLFRGHKKSNYKLETTLERSCNGKNVSLKCYDQLLKKQIADFKKQYENCSICRHSYDWNTCIDLPYLREIPGINCMCCLRQNGFPSPLLDWSKTLHNATKFAFNIEEFDNETKMVSIFVFLETTGHGKSYNLNYAHIRTIGHTIETDSKHDELDSEYTICVAQYNDKWFFASHEDVFMRNEEDQDCLWKFNIPVTEEQKILKILRNRGTNTIEVINTKTISLLPNP